MAGVLKTWDVERAKEAAARGEQQEIPDGEGLSIRIKKQSASWTFRKRFNGVPLTLTVAPLADLGLAKARDRVRDASALIKRGVHPGEFFKFDGTLAEYEKFIAAQAAAEAKRVADLPTTRPEGMEWPDAVEQWLAHVALRRRPATVKDYRQAITCPAVRESGIDKKRLSEITEMDIRIIQDAMTKGEIVTAARKTVSAIRRMMKWAAKRGDTGIKVSPLRDMKLVDPMPVQKGYLPTVSEIEAVVWLLDKDLMHPSLRFAAMLLLFTSQRARTICSARTHAFQESENGDGNLIWRIEDIYIKRGPAHALPLGPVCSSVVKAAIALAGGYVGNGWLFPQLRLRREGDKGGSHVPPSTLTHKLKDIKAGYSPHDTRRALVQHGKQLGISANAAKLILHHREGFGDDVTDVFYDNDERLDEKRPLMFSWEAWVVERIKAHKAGSWPVFMPPLPAPTTANDNDGVPKFKKWEIGYPSALFPGALTVP